MALSQRSCASDAIPGETQRRSGNTCRYVSGGRCLVVSVYEEYNRKIGT
ncbi:MAG: hypothetical protein LBH00_03150 [Planctomycetaceae bacterium]|nr:hypothetical protein [Planctomycetaceae bacterium]